jgi:DNA primase small subunit
MDEKMNEKTNEKVNEEIFVRKKFQEYYSSHYVKGPKYISSREFGFGTFDKKIESRHFSFSSEYELNSYLKRNAPIYISYSVAKYRYPTARMDKKEMISSDIVFDIDANEVAGFHKLNCDHDKKFVCEKCFEKTIECTQNLIDFLKEDFGLSNDEIEVNSSGNRGFHVHIIKDIDLDSNARRKICNYLNGNIQFIFENVRPNSGGWKGRIANFFLDKLRKGELKVFRINKKKINEIYQNITKLQKNIEEGNWSFFSKRILENIKRASIEKYSCCVDQQVTIDLTKLIRLPDSLHGETGFVAKRIKISDLDSFKFEKIIVFSQENKIKVKADCGKFFLDEYFGPYKGEVELPEYLAIYLICKKVASLA